MKVVISARNFVFDGCGAVDILKENGFEIVDITDKEIKSEENYLCEIIDADAVINAFEPMSRELLEKCEKLKLISVRGVGYDYIDSKACSELGIAITRTVGTVGESVSELTMGYILRFAREIEAHNANMQNGKWERIMTEGAFGKMLGIIGFGEIGQALAKKADAFGMRVIYNCITPKNDQRFEYCTLDRLLKESDYVVLALPLTKETQKLIDENALSKMKNSAVLINVARAGIVDNDALKRAVLNGEIRGAAVDVYESEPCCNSILRGVKNVILTPHIAPFTRNNFISMNTLAAENVINYFGGTLNEKYLA